LDLLENFRATFLFIQTQAKHCPNVLSYILGPNKDLYNKIFTFRDMNGFISAENKADLSNTASFEDISLKDLPATVDWRDKVNMKQISRSTSAFINSENCCSK
jgi:hypothetical protein